MIQPRLPCHPGRRRPFSISRKLTARATDASHRPKHGQMQAAAPRKAEALIDTDCWMVVCEDVEKWRLATAQNVCDHLGHQGTRVALASSIGMRANCAHLSESWNVQPLASHGHQAAGFEDAEEVAEFAGARAKWPRLRQVRELQHCGDISGSQYSQRRLRVECRGAQVIAARPDHLAHQTSAHQ